VTVAFVAAMALVLLAVGWLIYVRYRSELNASIDRGLRSRAGDVGTLVRVDRRGTSLPIRKESLGEDNFAQVLTPSGRVLDAIPRPTRASVLTVSELRDASPGPVFVERPRVEGIDGPARLIATSVRPCARSRRFGARRLRSRRRIRRAGSPSPQPTTSCDGWAKP
jgi:hypothetical protein